MIRSTLVICCMVSVACRIPYWTIPVKIRAWDIAKPTFPLNVSAFKRNIISFYQINRRLNCYWSYENYQLSYRMMKLNVTLATNAVLTQSIHKPHAVFEVVANCQTALWTSCSPSNSFTNFVWTLRARIVLKPLIVEVKCEKTGLRPVQKWKNPSNGCSS